MEDVKAESKVDDYIYGPKRITRVVVGGPDWWGDPFTVTSKGSHER